MERYQKCNTRGNTTQGNITFTHHSSRARFVSGQAQQALHLGFSAGAAFSCSAWAAGGPVIEDSPSLSNIFSARDAIDVVCKLLRHSSPSSSPLAPSAGTSVNLMSDCDSKHPSGLVQDYRSRSLHSSNSRK